MKLLVTDLDNTLYDWVLMWHESFRAMLDRTVRISEIPEDVLIPEIKGVHERHGTSEYAFVLQELPSLLAKHAQEQIPDVYKEAIDAYRAARTQAMRLYPGVMESLLRLKDGGCVVVGYTESKAFYTAYRVRNLGLDGILDVLYSPEDHTIPDGVQLEQLRRYPTGHYNFAITQHRHTPRGELKPNPDILRSIVAEVGADLNETLYVGDSLFKDIAMAQSAGVIDVWAKYGAATHRNEYELLRRVTHWTAEDVEKEKKVKQEHLMPSHTLETLFSELLCKFDFDSNRGTGGTMSLNHSMDAWKKTVDVQQHFNDVAIRIRSFALTLITAVVGAAALSVKSNQFMSVGGLGLIPIASVLCLIALIMWTAFYLMDRFWYHQYLVGAVKHGEMIERSLANIVPEIGLTQAISAASPTKFLGLRSKHKLNLWYLIFGICLVLLIIAFGLAVRPDAGRKVDGEVAMIVESTLDPVCPPSSPSTPTGSPSTSAPS